jgi:cell division protein FtsL
VSPPAASSAARAAPLAPRRPFAPPRPRRVSGPLRVPARNAPARRAVTDSGGLVLGLLGMLEALSSHRLLDRLIRGRMWIGIVAFALIGIVTLQLGLLKLNSSIGHALEAESQLQRENAALSIENSELAGGNRVESQAERLGMRLTSVGGLQFHESHARSDVPQAAAALRETPKPAEATAAEAPGSEATSSEASSSASGESAPEASSSTGGAPAEGAGTSSEASSEAGGSAEPSTASSGGESSEASAPSSAGAAEPSTEAGGGTAAPGG